MSSTHAAVEKEITIIIGCEILVDEEINRSCDNSNSR